MLRKTRLQVTATASLLVGIWSHPAAGRTQITVKLEVPLGQSPQFLCVVGDRPSCEPTAFDGSRIVNEQHCRTRELADLVKARSLRLDRSARDGGFAAPDPAALAAKLGGVELPLTLATALSALAQAPSQKCEEAHGGCAPRIDLHGYFDEDDVLTGRLICGKDDAASGGRVAILSLKFNDTGSGIREITLHGKNAMLMLDDNLDARGGSFLQVIGGHYAPSTPSPIGADNSAALAMQPRCAPFIAELPPQFPKPITKVTLTAASSSTEAAGSPSTGAAAWTTTQATSMTCAADEHGDQLPIQIPFGASARRTTLSVTTASNDGMDTAMSRRAGPMRCRCHRSAWPSDRSNSRGIEIASRGPGRKSRPRSSRTGSRVERELPACHHRAGRRGVPPHPWQAGHLPLQLHRGARYHAVLPASAGAIRSDQSGHVDGSRCGKLRPPRRGGGVLVARHDPCRGRTSPARSPRPRIDGCSSN